MVDIGLILVNHFGTVSVESHGSSSRERIWRSSYLDDHMQRLLDCNWVGYYALLKVLETPLTKDTQYWQEITLQKPKSTLSVEKAAE